MVRFTGAENPRSSDATGGEGTSRKRNFSVRLRTLDEPVRKTLARRQRQLEVLAVAAEQPELDGDVQRLLPGLAGRRRQHLR